MAYPAGPSYSISVRVRIRRKPGALARVAATIGEQDGLVGSIPVVKVGKDYVVRDFDVYARDDAQEQQIVNALAALPDAEVLFVTDRTFAYHEGGKIEIRGRRELVRREDLSMAYTPGVARICTAIAKDEEAGYVYTMKGNTVAIVTDGTAVLGLGDIGPLAALPVMEGKAMIFREFGDIYAFPLCLDVTDVDRIVEVVKSVSPGFAAINLEDISAPRCFEVERRLYDELDIPVFHDDQHGTSIAILAALKNALIHVGKELRETKIVVSGIGAAGAASVRILLEAGAGDVLCCDRHGALFPERSAGMSPVKHELAMLTNRQGRRGTLRDCLDGADVFIGVSAGNLLDPPDLKRMADSPIVFALANPIPEVDPWAALDYAEIVATGRSDFPNQINNALVFPGIFRGALDVRARKIDWTMKMAAATAIADMIPPEELAAQNILPGIFNRAVSRTVAEAVAKAALASGAA